MRQASRRSWRIGQTQPVQVVFMAYRNTLQADALKLVAKKLQSSLAVEGELPEDGLAAYGDDGDDLMLASATVSPRSSTRRCQAPPRRVVLLAGALRSATSHSWIVARYGPSRMPPRACSRSAPALIGSVSER